MNKTPFALTYPLPRRKSIKCRFLRYIIIVIAIVLIISPDPFSDALAFGLLGKVGAPINFKRMAIRRKKIFKGDPLKIRLS